MIQARTLWQPILLGLLITFSLLALLHGGANSAQAAPDDVYCVVPSIALSTTYAACDRVFTTLQDAVDASIGGEEIRVAAGHYLGVQQRSGVTQSVYLNQPVSIRGGYTVPFAMAPDALANPTRIDAQGMGRVFYITENISVTITGLEIVGGNATNLGGSTQGFEGDAGGGIYAQGSRIIFRANTIRDNIASSQRYGFGGAILLFGSQVEMSENILYHNIASLAGDGFGGAVYVDDSQVTFSQNTLFENTAAITAMSFSAGGGINVENSVITITNNLIYSNTALLSGTLATGIAQPHGFGGGIAIGSGDGGRGVIVNNTIQGNIAHKIGTGFGGGIYVQSQELVLIQQNRIEDNIASQSGLGDGFGGGIGFLSPARAVVEDNLIARNIAAITGTISLGGGVSILSPDFSSVTIITLTRNIIRENTALGSGEIGVGGGLYLDGQISLMNNIIMSNTALITERQVLMNGNTLGGIGGGVAASTSRDEARITFSGDLIQANIASLSDHSWGGGLYIEDGHIEADNLAIIDNQAATAGGGIAVGGRAQVSLRHITLAGNQSGDGSGLYVYDTLFNKSEQGPSTVALTNTILSNQPIGLNVTGNTTTTVNGILWDQTPLTVQASPTATLTLMNEYTGTAAFAGDGYHILPGSMAIDRGVSTAVLVDIDDQLREGAPDLGADELGLLLDHYFPYFAK